MTQPISNPGGNAPKEKKVDSRQWYQKKRWILPIGLVVLSVISSAINGDTDTSSTAEPTQTPEATQTIEASPTQDASSTIEIPDLVGKNTADALDELEALGFLDALAQDASYEERNVLVSSNWYVCEILPTAGTLVSPSDAVVLLSVKNSEACPNPTGASSGTEADPESTAQESPASQNSSAFGPLTKAQIKMNTVITDYQAKYDKAENDLQKGNLRLERDEAICSAIGGSKVSGWSGVVEDFGATSEGYAYVRIAISDDVTLETWSNEFSDVFDNTLVKRGTALYDTLLNLKKGQVVTFSGKFIPGDGACLDTKNLTEVFAMYSPEFVFKFSSIKP